MGRKPNYRADRIERERAKASKKAKRMEAKTGRSSKQQPEDLGATEEPQDALDATAKDEGTGETIKSNKGDSEAS